MSSPDKDYEYCTSVEETIDEHAPLSQDNMSTLGAITIPDISTLGATTEVYRGLKGRLHRLNTKRRCGTKTDWNYCFVQLMYGGDMVSAEIELDAFFKLEGEKRRLEASYIV